MNEDFGLGVLVLGMHRSGTSAITRGIRALGIDLGTTFLETRFDNPTGYWEDREIVGLHDRILETLGMTWESYNLIDNSWWDGAAANLFVKEARHYLAHELLPRKTWAFKDPRTIRLLPLWKRILKDVPCEIRYVLVIRNPVSVAASLYQRQEMPGGLAYRIWLAYLVPYLHQLFECRLVVVDYDLFMDDPEGQLLRIARAFGTPELPATVSGIRAFSEEFLRQDLRHTRFDERALASSSDAPEACKRVYSWLLQWAASDPARTPADSDGTWTELSDFTEAFLSQA